jgi:hypothetical protein
VSNEEPLREIFDKHGTNTSFSQGWRPMVAFCNSLFWYIGYIGLVLKFEKNLFRGTKLTLEDNVYFNQNEFTEFKNLSSRKKAIFGKFVKSSLVTCAYTFKCASR